MHFPFTNRAEGVSISRVAQPNKLFGTDGVRGDRECRAGHGRDGAQARPRRRARFHAAESARRIRPARGRRSSSAKTRGSPVTCSRTRSSPASLRSAWMCCVIGPLPTPGVAYITRSLRADAGIVLSASHNSYEDNGIKFFRHDGYKLDDADRAADRAAGLHRRDRFRSADRGENRPGHANRRRARALRRVRQGEFPARDVARENAHRGRCGERRGLQIDALHSARTGRRLDGCAQRPRTAPTSTPNAAALIPRRFSGS